MKSREYLLKLKENIIKQQNNEKLSNATIEEIIQKSEMNLHLKTEEELNEILENVVKTFFPKKGDWWANCFNKPKNYTMKNLPCHLRDNKWLAKMLQIEYNLGDISYRKILDFINNFRN